MSMGKQIRFNNGKLKVLQISDLQDTKETSVDTLHFIEGAMNSVKPDLIVFTGDQLDVVGLWGKGEKNKKTVRNAIKHLFGIFEKYNVPYVLTFGNHDHETGVENDEQAEIYKEFTNCICFDDMNDGRPDCGTYNVPIMSSDGEKTALNFYMVDSHSSIRDEGYEKVNQNQINWCAKKSAELAKKNGGEKVPSMIFQHIPVCEIYELMKEVPKGTKGALPAFRSRKGKYFILNEETVTDKGLYGETPATANTNSGQFESAINQDDVFAMYFGHDHYNSFIGKVQGIDLGYCPGAGYNTYGHNERMMRVFEFDENDVKNYKTYTVKYSDFCSQSITQPIKNFVYSHAPSCPQAAGPFIVLCTAITAAIVTALILLYYFVSQMFVVTLVAALAVAAVIYTVVSFFYNRLLRRRIWKKY